MRRTNAALVMAALAGLGAGFFSPGNLAQKPAVKSESRALSPVRKRQRVNNAWGGLRMAYASHVASGRTVAQDKRDARKKRNKKR